MSFSTSTLLSGVVVDLMHSGQRIFYILDWILLEKISRIWILHLGMHLIGIRIQLMN
jgi:hypothetical protein